MKLQAAFLGHTAAPVFDLASVVGPKNDCLIRSPQHGAALAAKFEHALGHDRSTSGSEKGGILRALSIKSKPKKSGKPCRPLVLMRSHGATITGNDIKQVVYRAYYARENAKVLQSLHLLLGGIPGIALDNSEHQGITMLGAEECNLTRETIDSQLERPWSLWVAEVENAERARKGNTV